MFDYRSASDKEIYDATCKCSPFHVPLANHELAYLFLSEEQYDRLVPWIRWKEEEGALSDKIVPYVEAGYPGNIPISSIEEVWRVTIAFPPNPIGDALDAARDRSAQRRLNEQEAEVVKRVKRGDEPDSGL